MTFPLTLLPAGDTALVAELGDAIDPALNDAVQALDAALVGANPAGLIETVPTYRSLLVHFDPCLTDADTLGALIRALAAGLDQAGTQAGRRWFLPVCFGGDLGEDLGFVAGRTGRSEAEVIGLHCAADYRVYMLGFSPGFAYLGGLPAELHLPRRDNPRLSTPAGSIMQGGAQACVSPMAMPSGWHILGQTPVMTFDLRRDQPFLLAPGDRVRFMAIDRDRFAALATLAAAGDLMPDSEALA
ncbi:MAG: 5-oxoprolinase subunit PxpB [Alphaproteobacteria bacterium]|jgi:KipI family sensor histidine kinase inhibitor|nr:5-oxoprolinase subunit PxpB [Alphaproteobacteria bacterium]